MNISSGTRLGQYEIVDRLGAGGMGEVYRARDTRLGRDVALKALSGELSLDPVRLSRFEAEARSASALNHPSIVTIHEIGQDDGTPFIVMELVDGKTLRELLYTGALPLRRTVALAAQLADALARAHEAGIVHRDLKPENVMVTRDGLLKILDFGLAKVESRDGENGADRRDLTVTEETREGAVVGTSGYMSPEQASGQPVDFRSDQFAFGTVLYELLIGKRAFHAASRAETLAAIIRDEAEPIGTIAPRVPPPLRWIVERCLAKLPEERYASTRDLARDLQSVRDHFSQIEGEASPLVPSARRRARGWLPAGVALAVAALVASAWVFGGASRDRDQPSFRRLTYRDGTVWSARVAPDGQTIVYGAAWGTGPIRLYSTRPEIPESVPLPLPPANVLAISPSGEMAVSLGARPIGPFVTVGTLARSTLAGGGPREVLEAVQAADWAADGASLAVVRFVDGRSRLEFPIGRTLVDVPSGYLSHPRVSPRGDLVAFVEHPMRGDDGGAICLVDREGRKRVLAPGWISARGLAWSPDGGEVWFTAASSGATRSLHAVTLSGRRRLVLRSPGALTLHDISREGRVLLAREGAREGILGLPPGADRERELSWHDWSRPVDLTADGTQMLFDETGEGEAPATRSTSAAPMVPRRCAWVTATRSPCRPMASGPSQRRTRPPRSSSSCRRARASRSVCAPGTSRTSCARPGSPEASASSSAPTSPATPRGCTSSRRTAAASGRSRPRAPARRGPSRRTARASPPSIPHAASSSTPSTAANRPPSSEPRTEMFPSASRPTAGRFTSSLAATARAPRSTA